MKKTFTPAQVMSNRGCYEREEVEKLPFMNLKKIHIKRIQKDLPLKDWYWFLFSACELSVEQKQELCYELALMVLPIYEKKYPNDDRVRKCIEGIKAFRNSKITRSELMDLRRTAAAAYADAAYAADAAAAAAAAAAADAADAADAAAYDAAAAADAADAAADIKQQLIDFTLNWIDKN